MYKKSFIKIANNYCVLGTTVGTNNILVNKNFIVPILKQTGQSTVSQTLKCIGITLDDLLKHRLFGPTKKL